MPCSAAMCSCKSPAKKLTWRLCRHPQGHSGQCHSVASCCHFPHPFCLPRTATALCLYQICPSHWDSAQERNTQRTLLCTSGGFLTPRLDQTCFCKQQLTLVMKWPDNAPKPTRHNSQAILCNLSATQTSTLLSRCISLLTNVGTFPAK